MHLLISASIGGNDYVPITTSLSFTSTQQSNCILFNIVESVLDEPPVEFFTITVGPATATITIIDSSGTMSKIRISRLCGNFLLYVALTIQDAIFSENNSTSVIELPVTLTANISSMVVFPVTFNNETATGKIVLACIDQLMWKWWAFYVIEPWIIACFISKKQGCIDSTRRGHATPVFAIQTAKCCTVTINIEY